ncbi:MAG TPA: beta-propeller fold lactonase family protein [Candidatus Acidoferrales bacterium]|nr:beta-propeller fold lactonase family protein [Candidatus Acidoferrales bacterium]
MLQKALILVLICVSVAGFVSCGKTGSHYVYAAIPATSQLAVFREDPFSGVLTQLSESPYPVGSGAQSVVIHPSGKFLYVANSGQGENDVSLFDINGDGTVSEVTPRTSVGTLPFLLALDSAGSYLYVANALSNNISVFSIDATNGTLTPVVGSPFSINLSPKNMQLAPSGKFLYVSAPSQPTGVVAVFSVNAGALSLVAFTLTADNNPAGLAIDPSGSFLYTANATASSISIYCIVPAPCTRQPAGPSGTLQSVAQSPLADTFQHPVALIVDPTGKFLYVANQGSNNISTYSITSGTGFPVVITDSPFGTESQPSFLVADPNGKYLFVGNQTGSAGIQAFGVSSGSLNSIATYSVGNSPTSIAVLQ